MKLFIILICVLATSFANNIFAQENKQTVEEGHANVTDTIPNAQPNKVESNNLFEPNAIKVENEKFKREVNDFLDIEDISIFNINFKSFELPHMHPRNRLYYQLISNIHDLDTLLAGIDMEISQMEDIKKEMEKVTKNIKSATDMLSNIQDLNILLENIDSMKISNIKLDFEKARNKIGVINTFATDEEKKKVSDFLSEEQKQYFRSLVDTCNVRYKQFFINNKITDE